MAKRKSWQNVVPAQQGTLCLRGAEGARYRRIGKMMFALGGALSVGGAFAADTLVLPVVVVSATRIEQSSFDLPVAIDVVTGEQMQNGQFMVNASESLSRVPGIVASNQYRFSSDQQVSSRGFGARSGFGVRGIRLYADGVPQSMPDGQGQMGTFSLSSAERMEVLRGPFSALYGNSSGGVIQIFTRDGAGAPRATASAYAGSFDTWRADLLAEGLAGGIGYLVDMSRYQTGGYRDHSAARRDQLNTKLTWHMDDQTKATLVLNSLDQPYSQDPQGLTRSQMEANPRQTPTTSITQNTGGSKSQTQFGLNLEHRLTDQDTLQAIGWIGGRKTFSLLSVPFSATAVIKGSGGISAIDRNFSGTDLRWSHKTSTPTGPLTVTMGLNYEYMNDARTGYENNGGVMGVLRRDENNIAWNSDQYVQAEWGIGNDWILSGGVRQSGVHFENKDHYIRTTGAGNPDDSGMASYSNTSPVLGVVYHLTPAVNLYANAGKGFETPTFIEMAYQPNGASGLNFGLKPSTSRSYEAGIKAFVTTGTRINLALFEVKSNKEIVADTSSFGRTTYANAGKTGRSGLELSVDNDLGHEFKTHLAYTILDASFKDAYRTSAGTTIKSGNKLPGTPGNTFYGELSWRHPASGFSTALEARYSGKVYVDDINSDAAAAYTLFNWKGGFEQRLSRVRLNEFLRVENLGDKRYAGGVLVNDSNARFFAPAPGRNYLLGVSASMEF
jgi:iron complex outermembrane receptor protein